jgi:hypothetical protein
MGAWRKVVPGETFHGSLWMVRTREREYFGERCGVISRWRYLVVSTVSRSEGRFGWIDGVGLGKQG